MARRDGELASAISIAEARADCTEFKSTALISGWLSTIEQLAKIGRVPEEEGAHLRRKIAELVSDANLDWASARETWLIQFLRVFEARSRFAKAAIELQLAIANYDEAYGKAQRCEDVAPQRIDKLLNDILSWRDSPCLLTLMEGYVGPQRGRPTVEITSPLWLFAVLLVANIENAGGRLTFDKNYPAAGSLVRALELLRPYVPWLIPQVIPIRTLIAVRRATNKGFEGCMRAIAKDEKITVEAAERLLKSMVKSRVNRNGN